MIWCWSDNFFFDCITSSCTNIATLLVVNVQITIVVVVIESFCDCLISGSVKCVQIIILLAVVVVEHQH